MFGSVWKIADIFTTQWHDQCLSSWLDNLRVSTVSWIGMKPTGRVSFISISFISTRTLPKWLCGMWKHNWKEGDYRRNRPRERKKYNMTCAKLISEFTYIFFREDPGEAEVAGNLGFEKAIFPQVSIQAICCCTDLEAEKVRESRQRQIEYLAVTAGCFLWMKRFGVEAMWPQYGRVQ